MRRHAARWPTGIGAFVLGLAVLTGCAIDKGSALAADFEESWAGTPDVADIRTTKNNTLPFSGTSTGTLVLEDGTPADRVRELADELGEYVARNDATSGRITAGGITFSVVADRTRTREVLALWQSLEADGQVKGADIEDAPWKGEADRWRIDVDAAGMKGGMVLFKDISAEGGSHRPLPGVTVLKVEGPGLLVESAFGDRFPTEAVAAYDAVSARYPVAAATLRRDAVSGSAVRIVVPLSADIEQAGELARSAAPNLGDAVEVVGEGR
ncbi:hypothetical protein AMK10_22850 [Streptomyces sp. CB02058]|nr:hypothetical protein AMK10_22850 [Streptomyces sp. CB02058]